MHPMTFITLLTFAAMIETVRSDKKSEQPPETHLHRYKNNAHKNLDRLPSQEFKMTRHHGSPDRDFHDHGSPDHGSHDHGSPDRGSHDHGSPDRGLHDHESHDHHSETNELKNEGIVHNSEFHTTHPSNENLNLTSRKGQKDNLINITMEYPDQSKDSDENETQESDSSEVSKTTPNSWSAPPYYKALELYNTTLKDIESHFRRETFTYKHGKNFRFIVISVVVDGLSRLVVEKGWKYYDDNYKTLVKSLGKKAALKPQESVETIQCMFRRANENIQEITTLISNKWVQYICKVQPESCDTVIFSHIKMCGGGQTEQEADLLLKLGDAAAAYMNIRFMLDIIREENTFYLMHGKEAIRKLVKNNAIVLDALYPNGVPSRSSCVGSQEDVIDNFN